MEWKNDVALNQVIQKVIEEIVRNHSAMRDRNFDDDLINKLTTGITNTLGYEGEIYERLADIFSFNYTGQDALILEKLNEIFHSLERSDLNDCRKINLLIKSWHPDNAIGLADLLNFEHIDIRTAEEWEYDIEYAHEIKCLHPDKYYTYRLKDGDFLYTFEEVSNDKLLEYLAKFFNKEVFDDMNRDVLEMLKIGVTY